MRILQIHNKYQQYGGEDAVLKLEYELLLQHGHIVEQLYFDNNSIQSVIDKLSLIYKTIYNNQSKKIVNQKIFDFKPDIIHVHNFFPLASPSIFYAAKKIKIPVVMTFHNYRLICANAELYRNHKPCFDCIQKTFPLQGVKHACYRNSSVQSLMVMLMSAYHKIKGTWKNQIDGYIALTEYSKNLLVNSSLQINPDKIFVKSNFILSNKSVNIDNERTNRYLFVGRLIETKGILTLLEAAKLFSFELDIIGDGPLRKTIEDYCKEHKNISYLGFQNQEYILDKLSTCKALIFPSIKIEGFPVTIVEAFSTSTPVLAADNGPINEIIKHDENGFLFKSLEELVKLLRKINNNELSIQHHYHNALESYRKLYSQEINYQKLMSIYKNIIERN